MRPPFRASKEAKHAAAPVLDRVAAASGDRRGRISLLSCDPCAPSSTRRRDGCLPRWLRRLWLALVVGWLLWLLKGLIRLCRLAHRDQGNAVGNTVPAWAHQQADPLIYSQVYLQSLGLAVTWDNPDIHVESPAAPGVPVDAHDLKPDTAYLVVARVWNGSTSAPAPGLPVRFSYLSFGAGTARHDVATTTVDLPVKAAPGCPATATVAWRTPATPGHYCLQVELLWDDDANPANNLGQSNTDVKPLNSPHAAFTFPVRNNLRERAVIALTADGYTLPPLEPCRSPAPRGAAAAAAPSLARLDRHRAADWPLPAGWQVVIDPSEVALGAGAESEVTVDITAPDGFVGRQAINVHATSGSRLIGGVTLYVDGS
jgi:hypothetical protein